MTSDSQMESNHNKAPAKKQTVMIMAGGTGGHVFPGIALAVSLAQQNIDVVWLGTEGGMEQQWVEKAQIPFFKIAIKGLRGNGLKGWLMAPIKISQAFLQARAIIKQLNPGLVLGMGGFVCGPGGLAAKSFGLPMVLHEQNAIPGLTNKLLAPLATKVVTAFAQDKIIGDKVMQMGNPVRKGLESISSLSHSDSPFKLLVLGGSRGALALNETLPKALALMPADQRPRVVHQTGVKTLAQAQGFYQQAGLISDDHDSEPKIVAFIDDMVTAYAQADLVVCRAGALTVSELMASARPALMVPYPHAVDDHQTANAQALVEMAGGEILPQSTLTPAQLAEKLEGWLNREKLQAASRSIREKAPSQATQNISQLLMDILRSH